MASMTPARTKRLSCVCLILFVLGGSGGVLAQTRWGEATPGMTPVPFAPDILCADYLPHGSLTFSADDLEIYWSVFYTTGNTILFSEFDGAALSPPEVAPFATTVDNGAAFSLDGSSLYFSSDRPLPDSETPSDAVWQVERQPEGWGDPTVIESTIDLEMTHGQTSVAANGNLYFVGRRLSETNPRIFLCRFVDGEYQAPEELPGPLATLAPAQIDPYIDPAERFLLFCSNNVAGYTGRLHVYMSPRQTDGTWGAPVNLGPAVNVDGSMHRFPSLSRDQEYLFFARATGSQYPSEDTKFYWVSSSVVPGLPCCLGRVGNANGNGGDEPTISDISVLIDAKFISGSCEGVLGCLTEADINQSGGANPDCDDITISDISILIDYLFITGQSLGLPACLAGDAMLEIPDGAGVVVDGHLQPGEWADAETLLLLVDGAVDVTVLVKHDGVSLLAAYCYTYAGAEDLCFPEILIDPENNKSVGWQYDDRWFHVSGTDCEARGAYDIYTDCSVVQPDWQGVPNFELTPDPPPIDTFEVRIPLSKIGVAVGDTIGVSFRVEYVPAMFGYWPASAVADSPASWGTAIIKP